MRLKGCSEQFFFKHAILPNESLEDKESSDVIAIKGASGCLDVDMVCTLCRDLCSDLHIALPMPTNTNILKSLRKADEKLTDALDINDFQRAFKLALKSIILHAYRSKLEEKFEAPLGISKSYFQQAARIYESVAFIYGNVAQSWKLRMLAVVLELFSGVLFALQVGFLIGGPTG